MTALNYFRQTIVTQNEWVILRQVEFSPWFFGVAKIYQRRWAIQFSRRIILDEAGEFSFVSNDSSKLVSVIPQFPEFPWGNCKEIRLTHNNNIPCIHTQGQVDVAGFWIAHIYKQMLHRPTTIKIQNISNMSNTWVV